MYEESSVIKHITVKTDNYIVEELPVEITLVPHCKFDRTLYHLDVAIMWKGDLSYEQGVRPSDDSLDILERQIERHVLECVAHGEYNPDEVITDLNLQTVLAQGKTSYQIVDLCLYYLYEVDNQMSALKYIINMDGFTYWYQLYRVATLSLHDNSSNEEILAVRTIQTLVSLQTLESDDVDYDETKAALLDLLDKRVRILLQ